MFIVSIPVSWLLTSLIRYVLMKVEQYTGLRTPFLVNVIILFGSYILSFFVLTRRVVTDLRTMERGLEIISEGNLNHRVSLKRKDELGRVALNINLMAERLQKQMAK
ncbi:HAMP domain-containing protein [Paenibacillus lacisoli]|uniref:HAMP domain-containing protein n=1 Tax=Paenibacillus lacisoli TaxID=3064525 RepID=UPI0031F2F447